MRISKKTRDEAILILDVAASHAYDSTPDGHHLSLRMVCCGLGFDIGASASKLACAAYGHVDSIDAQGRGDAAGLLRDGWSPGDPVEEL